MTFFSSRTAARRVAGAAAATLLAAASGCSTPPDFFHTLRPVALAGPSSTRATPQDGAHLLAIGPVTVPDSLSRNEWVIRTGDTGARVYDHQLWTQGLAADVAQSLTDYLNRATLPGDLWADAGPTGSGSGADLAQAPTLRVRVQVMRFDSMLAPTAAISDQVRWTIECLPSDTTLSPVDAGRYHPVRSAVRVVSVDAPPSNEQVDEGQRRYDRIARAHSDALRAVAGDIAAGLRDSVADRARDCVQSAPAL